MTDDTTRRHTDATDAVRIIANGIPLEGIRSHLVTARQTIRLAASGADYADLPAAAGHLDAVLQAMCPHDAAGHYTAYADSGEELTTCTKCNVSWYTGRWYREGRS